MLTEHPTLFDDTKVSGWCVNQIPNDEELVEYNTAYASHTTCTRSKISPTDRGYDAERSDRWSWFLDDAADRDDIHICFECGEPVPEHIQALVVLHHV